MKERWWWWGLAQEEETSIAKRETNSMVVSESAVSAVAGCVLGVWFLGFMITLRVVVNCFILGMLVDDFSRRRFGRVG